MFLETKYNLWVLWRRFLWSTVASVSRILLFVALYTFTGTGSGSSTSSAGRSPFTTIAGGISRVPCPCILNVVLFVCVCCSFFTAALLACFHISSKLTWRRLCATMGTLAAFRTFNSRIFRRRLRSVTSEVVVTFRRTTSCRSVFPFSCVTS